VRSNGIDLRYESLGDPADPALLLVMGPGAQLIDWPAEFCDLLAARGPHVLLFDNRDSGSPGYPTPEAEIRRRATAKYDRSYRPAGTQRQYAAIIASPDRTTALAAVTVTAPTLVIHGEADPLIDVSGGRATAAAIPGAELLVLPGMGHDLPRELWPHLIEAIHTNTTRA
jgi:pimeloyl-ACP methyl ester carboxylesterase